MTHCLVIVIFVTAVLQVQAQKDVCSRLQADNSKAFDQVLKEISKLRGSKDVTTISDVVSILTAKMEKDKREFTQSLAKLEENQIARKKEIEAIELTNSFDCSNVPHLTGTRVIQADHRLVEVRCDKGWTTIARRFDGSVDFYRNWKQYQRGFGSASGEHFVGLNALASILKRGNYKLRIELTTWQGVTRYAEYEHFHISGEEDGYRLDVTGFSGNMEDSFLWHSGSKFTTYDNEGTYNCPTKHHGAWWYRHCTDSNLFGRYSKTGKCGQTENCIWWMNWGDSSELLDKNGKPATKPMFYSFKAVDMKIYSLSPNMKDLDRDIQAILDHQADIREHLIDIELQRMPKSKGTPMDCRQTKDSLGGTSIQTKDKSHFRVYCDNGWTSIARRFDGSVNFYRGWEEYREGFGSADGEFFIGLDNLRSLLSQRYYKLRIKLTSWNGETRHASYKSFSVGDASSKFRLSVDGYSGDAGDSLAFHNGNAFSTFDQDNDNSPHNCATDSQGAWWYKWCAASSLFGHYSTTGQCATSLACVLWLNWPKEIGLNKMGKPDNYFLSMKEIDMKVYPTQ